MDDADKKSALSDIMAAAHALADIAWPSDSAPVPTDGLRAIMDIQAAACRALDLPDDLPLLSGDPQIDGPI
jgi:hypothetical protein